MDFIVNESDVMTNHIVYDYGCGYVKHVYMKHAVRQRGFEEIENSVSDLDFDDVNGSKIDFDDVSESEESDCNDNVERSMRRAKNMIKNMALLNPWDLFITWTFDPKKLDSKNSDMVYKYILKFLKRLRDHDSGVRYLLIAEYHHDGEKIHFHGFIYDPKEKLKLVDSGKKTRHGQVIYNMPKWEVGFSTAVKLGKDFKDVAKASSYISKYITKGSERILPRHYLCSKGLINKPKTVYLNDDWNEDLLKAKGAYENEYCWILEEYNTNSDTLQK